MIALFQFGFVISLFWGFIFGFLTLILANLNRRNGFIAFIIGFLLGFFGKLWGLLALLFYLIIGRKRSRYYRARVKRKAYIRRKRIIKHKKRRR